jgi:hypothetical protein
MNHIFDFNEKIIAVFLIFFTLLSIQIDKYETAWFYTYYPRCFIYNF